MVPRCSRRAPSQDKNYDILPWFWAAYCAAPASAKPSNDGGSEEGEDEGEECGGGGGGGGGGMPASLRASAAAISWLFAPPCGAHELAIVASCYSPSAPAGAAPPPRLARDLGCAAAPPPVLLCSLAASFRAAGAAGGALAAAVAGACKPEPRAGHGSVCPCCAASRNAGRVCAWVHCERRAAAPLLMRCGGCRVVAYCSAECAAADWPGHKAACRATQATRAGE